MIRHNPRRRRREARWSPLDLQGIGALFLSDLGVCSDTALTSLASPNGTVGGWVNQVPSGSSMVQGTGAQQPVVKAGVTPSGFPAILFDGVNDNLSAADAFGITGDDPNFTITIVFATTAATTRQYFGGAYGTTAYRYAQINSTFKFVTSVKDDAGLTVDAPGSSTVVADLNWHVLTVYCTGAGATTKYCSRIDGVATGSETTNNKGVSTMDHFGVGTYMASVSTSPFKGYIAAVSVVPRMLTADELVMLGSWLGNRYGVVMP